MERYDGWQKMERHDHNALTAANMERLKTQICRAYEENQWEQQRKGGEVPLQDGSDGEKRGARGGAA